MSRCIGVVGSRRRASSGDYRLLHHHFFQTWEEGDTVVSGGCPTGGDQFAEQICRSAGLTLTIHYPNWNGPDGKRAGFVRNTRIAEQCDILLALVAGDRTGGTEDTICKCKKMGKPVLLLHPDGRTECLNASQV